MDTEARIAAARRWPRDIDNVRVSLLGACDRSRFAEVSRYAKPIGEDFVRGWSIRFAEEAIRALGNIDVQVVTLFDDPRQRIVEVTVMDLEANISYPTSISLEKTVERSKLGLGQLAIRTRVNSYGKPVYVVPATDDEVFMKQQNLVSKAIRNGALRLLPGDIQAECRERILAIRQGEVAKDPEGFKRRIIDAFAALNILPAMLEEYLRHPLAICTPAELDDLRGLHAALKEGRTTWTEVMAPAEDDAPAKSETEKPSGTSLDAAAEKLAAKNAQKAGHKDQPANPDADDPGDGQLEGALKASLDQAKPKSDPPLDQDPAFLRAQSRARGGK